MNLTKKAILLFSVICLIPIALAKPKGCTFSDLQGEYPAILRYLREDLKDIKKCLENDEKFPYIITNRLLMYGPPGNGKTTVAKKIAEEAGAICKYKIGADFVKKYIGTGAEEVEKFFIEAGNESDVHHKPVVIIIDEIDAIAAHVEGEHRAEHKAILQKLWHYLDEIQNDQRFIFIGITNSEEINETFKSRFGANICKIDAPDAAQRRAVLENCLMEFTGKTWKKSMLDDLVNRTDNKKLGIRFLVEFVKGLATQARHDHDGKITKELVDEVFEDVKKEYTKSLYEKAKKLAADNASLLMHGALRLIPA